MSHDVSRHGKLTMEVYGELERKFGLQDYQIQELKRIFLPPDRPDENKPKSYFEFLCGETPDDAPLKVIIQDLHRTFPEHASFQNGEGGQLRLRKVLEAYACHDRELGYCQGLAFVTALFLMYYEEEKAFWMLVAFLENEKYDMRGIYLVGLPLLHQRYFEL